MSGAPPPPPPPHGENPKTTSSNGNLPPGKYDIFIIPPHSAGSGFLYLPSLQPNVNSFAAGFASALVLVALGNSMAPAFRSWWNGFQGMGSMGVMLLVIAVAMAAWVLGRTQTDGSSSPGGGSFGGSQGGWGASGGQQWAGAGADASGPPPPPPPHGSSPPPPRSGPTPGAQKPNGTWQQHGAGPEPQPQPEPKPQAQQNPWERAREETRKREAERKAKEAEQKRKEEIAKRLKELREKEARERAKREQAAKEKAEKEAQESKDKADQAAREKDQREKEQREKELKEKLARDKEQREARLRESRERDLRERLEREKTIRERLEKEAKAREASRLQEEARDSMRKSTYAYSAVGEKTNPWPNGRPPSQPSSPASPNPNPSSAKRPPAPTARTTFTGTVDEETYSYRPYDEPKRHARRRSGETIFTESSYAPSQSTARTSPPPSIREPYSTKDPEKIVIKAVYGFMNQFAKTPASQLISGQGPVTDGLILRVTTEGLFIDDDVRGVPQREWDVKAWTLKLMEVWCSSRCFADLSAPSSTITAKSPSVLHKPPRTRVDRGNPKVLTGDDADAFCANMLRNCQNDCRLCPHGESPSSPHANTNTAGQSGEWKQQGLHVLRATIRDQEGKRFVFVLGEEEGWKVALGLQRLRKGTQVRQLGVQTMTAPEAQNALETLGWA
jgi:actin-related protein